MASPATLRVEQAAQVEAARPVLYFSLPQALASFCLALTLKRGKDDERRLTIPLPDKRLTEKEEWERIAGSLSFTADAVKAFGMTLLMTKILAIAYNSGTGKQAWEAAKIFHKENEFNERRRAEGLEPIEKEEKDETLFFFFAPLVAPVQIGVAVAFAALSLAALRGWRELTVLASATPRMMQRAGRRALYQIKAFTAALDTLGMMQPKFVCMPKAGPVVNPDSL